MENKNNEEKSILNISELAKWGSVFISVVTGAILLSDWFYTSSYYDALGATELARPSFLATPLHTSGFLSLWVGLQMIGAYSLLTILPINIIIKPLFKLISQKFHIPIIFFFIIFIFMEARAITKDFDTSSLSAGIIAVIPFIPVIPIVVLFWFFVENYIKDTATKNALFLVLILVSANFFFTNFIVKFSSAAGKSDGEKIIQGKQHLPIIALITKEKVLFSDRITKSQTDDGKWYYYPQSISNSQSGNTIVTMQLVGADERNIYILDLWESSVNAIPKDNITQVIYLNFSDISLISPGSNTIFSDTPTP